MDAWWYKIIGDASRTPWTSGDLPAGVDFLDSAFLNQFIDRLNLRIAAHRMVGGRTATLMNRIGHGEFAMSAASGGFIKTFASKFSAIDNVWIGPEDPSGETDSAAYYVSAADSPAGAFLSNLAGMAAGDADFQSYLDDARAALDAVTVIAREPQYAGYDYVHSRAVYGLAGELIYGNGTWRLWKPLEGDPDHEVTTGTFNYPFYPSTKIETLSGDADFEPLHAAGRMHEGAYCWMIQAQNGQTAYLYAPGVSIGYTLSTFFKGTGGTPEDFDWDGTGDFPNEDELVANATGDFVTGATEIESLALTGTFGSLTEKTSVGQEVYHVVGMLMITIDESTTPNIEE